MADCNYLSIMVNLCVSQECWERSANNSNPNFHKGQRKQWMTMSKREDLVSNFQNGAWCLVRNWWETSDIDAWFEEITRERSGNAFSTPDAGENGGSFRGISIDVLQRLEHPPARKCMPNFLIKGRFSLWNSSYQTCVQLPCCASLDSIMHMHLYLLVPLVDVIE